MDQEEVQTQLQGGPQNRVDVAPPTASTSTSATRATPQTFGSATTKNFQRIAQL